MVCLCFARRRTRASYRDGYDQDRRLFGILFDAFFNSKQRKIPFNPLGLQPEPAKYDYE